MTENVFKIEWRPMAYQDLRAIVKYIAKDNPTRAKSFGKELIDKTSLLSKHPELGRSGRPGLPKGLRELVVHSNYLVFYRVFHKTHTVEILRVKHGAQKIP